MPVLRSMLAVVSRVVRSVVVVVGIVNCVSPVLASVNPL